MTHTLTNPQRRFMRSADAWLDRLEVAGTADESHVTWLRGILDAGTGFGRDELSDGAADFYDELVGDSVLGGQLDRAGVPADLAQDFAFSWLVLNDRREAAAERAKQKRAAYDNRRGRWT